ncbi:MULTISPECIES: hypothetical protein [unclassified Microcoleus]|uniref:hypothetical protein n=1 Tax=unclassified Microcoleus TaxID=2642155 RepID=UPI002FD06A4A
MKLLKIKYVKQFDRKPCNQADAAGLAILQFLAARGEGATVSRLTILQHFPNKSDALNLLLQREWIEEVSEGYRFQVELIRHWFA